MKLLTFFLTLTFTTFFANVSLEDFQEDVANTYFAYEFKLDEHNGYFSMVIVRGIHDDKFSYGVYFYNQTANSLILSIQQNERYYELKSDNRGDIAVTAFVPKASEYISFIVTDNQGRSYYQIDLQNIPKENVLLKSDILFGANNPGAIQNLSRVRSFELVIAMIIALSGIIVLCFSVIIIWWATKKGMFKKEVREQDLFLFGKYYDKLPNREEDELVNSYFDKMDIEEKQESEESVFNKPYFSRYEEDILENKYDVEEHLRSQGLSTSYQGITEEEKNRIMLELMKLRQSSDLSDVQYQEEVVKLWIKSD